jgi:putative dimethyl sulfoxide reductase chaperone
MNRSAANASGGSGAAAYPREMAESAKNRAALYELLATLFRHNPSRQTLLSLRTTEMREALSLAGMRLPETFYSENVDELAQTLAVAFTNLFLLPGRLISPHESVQRRGGSGFLRGPETVRVRDYYAAVGFEVNRTTPMEADHVSIELEFLGHLANEEAKAWQSGNPGKASDALRYQEDFLNRHTGQWIFDFLARVESRDRSGFYCELARLTHDLCKEQLAYLPQLIEQSEQPDAVI